MKQKPFIMIGAAGSGSGKTTFTLGLLRLLRNRGMKVQPFKCGPDYIDTKHHAMAAGEESVNLDTYMASAAHVRELYARYGAASDVCVTEGVMGLFDGYDGMKGSSAEIAELIGIPVVLVLNAKSTAYTVAPVLYGFKHFYPGIQVVGVVFNFVASVAHYAYLQQACVDAGVEAIDETFCFDAFADRVAEVIDKTVNVDRLLELCAVEFSGEQTEGVICSGNRKIAIARDEAFNFMYRENVEALKRAGEVVFFSPLHDKRLPDADLVYFPGGYPELHLPELAANEGMRQAVRKYCETGGRVLAECGGMMYLCDTITSDDGKVYPMAGVLKQGATMEQMKLKLGYREVRVNGQRIRGHEFHYSRILPTNEKIPVIGTIYNAKDMVVDTPVYTYKNVLASYIHFYWGECGIDHFLMLMSQK